MKLTKDAQIELLNESIKQLMQENSELKLEVKIENTVHQAEVTALKYELKDFEFFMVKMHVLEKENSRLKKEVEELKEDATFSYRDGYNEGYASGFTDADERC